MNKKLILTLLPMMLLCACKSSSSSRVPTVPTITWTDTGTSSDTDTNTNSDVITGSVSVEEPSYEGAREITLEEAREIGRAMSEYQDSDEFSLPNELVSVVKTTGKTDVAIEGYSSLSMNEKCVFSASNYYYRTELSSSDTSTKNWRYIGSSPITTETGDYYLDATSTLEESTYTKEKINSQTEKDAKLEELKASYKEEQLDILTGKSFLGQLDVDDSDESTRIDCKYYTKGAGSLIVYGEIVVNNYEFSFGEASVNGSMKTAVSYVWDNYLIVSGSTDALFKTKVLFSEVSGSMKTTQTIATPKSSDFNKPNYSNFTEKEITE